MKFIMNRDHTVNSTSGHSIAFTKGQPVYVPKEMHREVVAAGAYPDDGEGEVDMSDKKVEAPKLEGAERDEMLTLILSDMKARNDRDDFTATGRPKVSAVAKMAGFDVAAPEIEALWVALNQGE